jgi:hypothetical protein
VQIGDNRAAEWVRRSNPVALGLLFSGLAGQIENFVLSTFMFFKFQIKKNHLLLEIDFPLVRPSHQIFIQQFVICSRSSSAHLVNLLRRLPATGGKLDNLLHLLARLL